jgi:hypothetical protein
MRPWVFEGEQGRSVWPVQLGLIYGGSGIRKTSAIVQVVPWRRRFPHHEERDQAIYNANQVAAKMTPAEIAEAQRLAKEWKPE